MGGRRHINDASNNTKMGIIDAGTIPPNRKGHRHRATTINTYDSLLSINEFVIFKMKL